MHLKRVLHRALCFAFLWGIGSSCTASAGTIILADAAATPHASGSPEAASLALSRQIAESHQAARAAIEKNDVRALTELHLRLQQSIALLREHIDAAILGGGWRDQAPRTRAFDVLNRLEGMRILSRINVTFLTGYPNPAGKVSASVADATERLMRQAEILSEDIAAVNQLIPVSAPVEK